MKSNRYQIGVSNILAFTLIELLVVIASCLSNNKQLLLAQAMYTNDNQDSFPWANWLISPNDPAGWLYKTLPPPYSKAVYNLNGPAKFDSDCLKAIQGGVYYSYMPNAKVFRCPLDGPGKFPAFWSRANQLGSYVMNGAAAYFPGTGNSGQSAYKTPKTTSLWSQECYVMWEPDFNSTTSGAWNDGSNMPDPAEGINKAHESGAIVGEVGGVAKFVRFTDFSNEESNPPAGTPGRGLLWWNPNTKDGH